ncbi:hypothetical protein CHLNCDRAFT_135883 [Chlorella variabilis]|uniref:TLDc domain-containing protein n=1 Tax=Chlorella variabilis TaxID=554065 RepID=E1ZJ79_CHLVA|nr:hypothetical protein CHLNCDRAFT_135883 [Chlorella variabilis]EFN54294.1 hypothetical protein CHLNCDRAFT_135883 [Chlorella variabilis]|eukprot:XP_005846396.1 hypothetical protein CHLNCDRAFT_135883 [Chlorella variabilis]
MCQRRRASQLCWRARAQEEDLIESFFGRLFGRPALDDPTPFGLKRVSEEAAKELYPAVTDTFAESLSGDNEDVAKLRPLLAQTQLESVPLRLAYDADQDGWTPTAFHQRVDGFGAALVVAETVGGAVVGGYNPRGEMGKGRNAVFAACPAAVMLVG